MEQEEYVPGVCNIGTEERTRRRIFGWTGLITSMVLLAVLFTLKVNPWWRLFIFFPAALSAIGFLQARARFCLAYGLAGIFNFEMPGKGHRVKDDAALSLDKKKANQILLCSLLIAMAVTLVAVVV